MLRDTSYALVRRLEFIEKALHEHLAQQGLANIVVADIGCGTGELLTIPLSLNLGKDAIVYAYEPESVTFQRLRSRIDELHIQNLRPVQNKESLQNLTYDAIVVSEVVEHVENPTDFLIELRRLLKPLGILVITTPNGYGIFELETMVFNTLELIGVVPILRKIKRSVIRRHNNSIPVSITDTLAISPHINFFTLGDLYQIMKESGFSITKIEGKHLAAGPFSDRIIDKSEKLVKLNAYLGGKLPLRGVAGWMVIAKKSEDQSGRIEYAYREKRVNFFRKIYSRYKRWLNLHVARKATSKE